MKLFKLLLRNQIREGVRSRNFAGNLAINIFLGVMYAFLTLQLLVAGFFIDEILKEIFPGGNQVFLINAYLLVYAIFDLKLRYFLQKIHGLTVVPYLHLPIKKNVLVHYLVSRSFFSLLNFSPLLIIIPAGIKIIGYENGAFAAFLWIANYFIILQCASLFNIYINRISYRNIKLALVYVALLVGIAAIYYFKLFNLENISYFIYGSVIESNWAIIFPIVLAAFLYNLNVKFMRKHLYVEDLEYRKESDLNTGNIKQLDNLGNIGNYLSVEIKLLLRNKRPRSTIIFTVFFLLFAFIAYTNPTYKESELFFIYFGMMLTGIFIISYGQFLMCWESSYYDLILTSKVQLRDYLKAKYYLMVFGATISFILLIPFAFMGIDILYRNIILYLYNLGVNAFVMFFLSSYSRKPVELDVSVMNQQGKGASQYVTIIPTVLLPLLIYLPFEYIGGIYGGYAALGLLGILGIISSPWLLTLATNQMSSQKYKMSEAFRNS